MNFPIDFFRDEIRNGFFISTAVKQAWAAQLIVLGEIDRICSKYGIKYYADWGTLLGAVRHGGYVPWDDDLDIAMKRSDYIRFKQIAHNELPSNFDIHDFEHKENHWLFLSRVVNNKHISFDEKHLLEFHNFPYLAAVDIFVLDYLYDDSLLERERCEEVKKIIWLADSIVNKSVSKGICDRELERIEQKYNYSFGEIHSTEKMGVELYRLAEIQMARVPESESNRIGQIFPWVLLGHDGFNKEYYHETLQLPFEMRSISVPAFYHQLLQAKYDDYFCAHKVWGGHEYPSFEGQRANLQAVAEFKLPEFEFEQKMLRGNRDESQMETTIKRVTQEMLQELERLQMNIWDYVTALQIEDTITLLQLCQEIAIDYGNYIEVVYVDEDTVKSVIGVLEDYCEGLYLFQVSLLQKNTNSSQLSVRYERLKKTIRELIIERKMVVFLSDNPNRWIDFETLYRYYCNQQGWHVIVIVLPQYRKNPYGEPIQVENDYSANMSKYPDGIQVRKWEQFDISVVQPDLIFVQNPYDNENSYLTIPKKFYAENIQKHTECLVYVMPMNVEEFEKSDKADMYQLKHYLTLPGAIYADRILIASSNMKPLYVEYLIAFAGMETKSIWEQKIVTMSQFLNLGESVMDPKTDNNRFDFSTLLYCFGENEIVESKDIALKKLCKRIETIVSLGDRIKLDICTYPFSIKEWSIAGEEVEYLMQFIVDKYTRVEWLNTNELVNDNCMIADAYYGSPSPLVYDYLKMKKPVMISQPVIL